MRPAGGGTVPSGVALPDDAAKAREGAVSAPAASAAAPLSCPRKRRRFANVNLFVSSLLMRLPPSSAARNSILHFCNDFAQGAPGSVTIAPVSHLVPRPASGTLFGSPPRWRSILLCGGRRVSNRDMRLGGVRDGVGGGLPEKGPEPLAYARGSEAGPSTYDNVPSRAQRAPRRGAVPRIPFSATGRKRVPGVLCIVPDGGGKP